MEAEENAWDNSKVLEGRHERKQRALLVKTESRGRIKKRVGQAENRRFSTLLTPKAPCGIPPRTKRHFPRWSTWEERR